MTRNKRIWYALFVFYCIAMAYLLFARDPASGDLSYWEQVQLRLNPVPFHTISKQVRRLFLFHQPWLARHSFINLFGNVLLFIPLGVFLPTLWKSQRRLWKVLLTAALIITTVELTQLLTLLGRCDIDDLILNLLGAAIGYALYHLIWKE